MTKGLRAAQKANSALRPTRGAMVALLAILVAALCAPAASAHGAPEPRAIDARLVTDGTQNGDYGFSGLLDEGGIDLLALDVREAYTQLGSAAIVMRLIMQNESAAEGRSVVLSFTAPDGPHIATLHQGDSWSATGALRVAGPTPVGDGHPYAIDVWFDATLMGAGNGTTLTDIVAESFLGDMKTDAMPGTWYRSGMPVPGDDSEPAQWTLAGPAQLLRLDASEFTAAGTDAQTFTATLTESSGLEQFVTVSHDAPNGTIIEGLPASILLAADASRALNFTVKAPNATTSGFFITFKTELGAFQIVPVVVTNTTPITEQLPPATTAPTESQGASEGEDAPGASIGLLALAMLVVLGFLRGGRKA